MFKKSIAFVCICLLLVGCNFSSGITPDTKGELVIQASELPSITGTNWTAHILLIRGKNELKEVIQVNGDSFTTNLSIPAGTWDISLHLVDDRGVTNYQDTLKDVTIYPNKSKHLDFQLRPANGQVQVLIDLSSYPDQDKILRVRVHFNNQIKEIIRPDANEPFLGTYSLTPGSYDFKVELFTESFRVGDKVDTGVWETIHIAPLSEQTISWLPFMEKLTITAKILTIPQAPTNLQAIYNRDHVALDWVPSLSTNVTAYRIFFQLTPFEPFEELATVGADSYQFVHDLSEMANLPETIIYCMEPVAEDIVGYRSTTAIVSLK